MNKKNWLKIVTIITVVILLIVLFIMNVCNDSFWSFDFYKIIYLGILIFISFFLTQHYNDERNRKEYILDVVDKLYDFVSSIDLNKIVEDNNKDYFNMKVRDIRNILYLLDSISKKYDISDDISYLDKEISEIDSTVSETKIDNISNLNKTIDRHKRNMIYKCESIKFTLMFSIIKKKKL